MDQNFHLIEKYFQGELSQEELQLFNQKLQEDSSFEQEFRDMKLIRDAVKETSRIRALDILQQAEANLTNQETTKINVSMKRLVSIAASLLIVATVSYFAFSGGTGALTGEEIVATYYEAYPNLGGPVRGENIEIVTLAARAYNAYDIEDYSTSADLFAELLTKERTVENYFYSGIANFEAGNLEMAKNQLNTVLNNFSEFNENAQWFLAMTLFKDGMNQQAISNIAEIAISGSNSKFSRQAADILTDLNLTISLDESGTGSVDQTETMPVEDSPGMGVEDNRRYQFGTITSLENGRKYKFFNDHPFEGLKRGDVVEFAVVDGEGHKPMAIILAALN